jgi:RimJ/RimL family protein N-acetyltransferase
MNPILLDIPTSLTTERLLLRPPQAGDGPELNAAVIESFDALSLWMPWAKTKPTVEESEENVRRAFAKWILREDLRVSIFDKATGKLAGSSGLHRINWAVPSFEIGYWARTSFVGKGYITESTNALTRFAFNFLKAKRVEIRCNSKNKKSIAVIERLGFEFEGCLRNSDTHGDETEPRDMLIYSRLSDAGLPALEVNFDK